MKRPSIVDTFFFSNIMDFPDDVINDIFALENIEQRPDKHPEGNVLKHTINVWRNVMSRGKSLLLNTLVDMLIVAIFHDIGKLTTTTINPKTGYPCAFGHEKASLRYLLERPEMAVFCRNFDFVCWMIENHQRIKNVDDMRKNKRQTFMSHEWYPYLVIFNECDEMGKMENGNG